MTDTGFWRGRRVFLTGHTGFKGAWASILLDSLGAEVYGLALPAEPGSVYLIAGVEPLLACSTMADVRDGDAVREALRSSRAEIVLHFAAQALVRPSYVDPVGTFATNVMGTVHVLDAARNASHVAATVVVTSDKCYENREWPWGYRETEAMGGYDPYSSSKGCAELATAAFRRSYAEAGGGLVASARAGNVIGGGDVCADRLVPDLVRAFRDGASAPIRNPDAVRPWQHVMEPISGYLLLAERLCGADGSMLADGWNFGPSEDGERTVGDVADLAAARWPGAPGWHRDGVVGPHEAHYLRLDSARARRMLGWRPRWRFEEAIGATLEWYRAQDAGHDLLDFTRGQIARYREIAPMPLQETLR